MSETNPFTFITNTELSNIIEAQTSEPSGKFQRRDFVGPLVKFCLDGNYGGRLGIVYGLRSTGKTVGMLQAAEELMNGGYKAAYARFNYEQSGMRDVNSEIIKLAKEGYTHFFIDEAPYLGGFLNESAEWADIFVPQYRIKIIISGTDSFELWLAMNRALYHRYVSFSTNRNTFSEYKRVWGKDFNEYKRHGGVFLASGEWAMSELVPGSQILKDMAVENFIENAVVDNLIHTLKHCAEYTDSTNYYTDWLYAIDKQVIFKGVISILKSTVEAFIRKNFIQEAARKNIPDLGAVISKWPSPEKEEVKARIAESIGIYQNSVKITDPAGSIDALTSFLIKIGCLLESGTGISDLSNHQSTLYFAHNALMNYAIEETKRGIMSVEGIDKAEFASSLEQAAEGALIENIVYSHLLLYAGNNDKVFRYRDMENREVDAVVINRDAKTLYLIEVKSKSKLDDNRVLQNEGRHLFDGAVLKNIGVDDSFSITRAIVYQGKTEYLLHPKEVLLLVNIEDLLVRHRELWQYLDQHHASANKKRSERFPKSLSEKIHEYAEDIKRDYTPPEKANGKNKPDIGGL
jgi:predicted AAA+ superfamily ATPase